MQREIKFRVWDKESKEMLQMEIKENQIWFGDVNIFSDILLDKKRFIIMQYTGLKANGVEIYEGDIIQEGNGNGRKATIEWITVDCAFAVQTHEPEIHTIGRHIREHGKIEVIGNVYEHSYLLDK